MNILLKFIKPHLECGIFAAIVLYCSCNRSIYTMARHNANDTVFVQTEVMDIVDTGYVYSILRRAESDFVKQGFCDRIKIRQYNIYYSDSIYYVDISNKYSDIIENRQSVDPDTVRFFTYKDIPVLCWENANGAQQFFFRGSGIRKGTIGKLNVNDVRINWLCHLNRNGEIIESCNSWKYLSKDPDYDKKLENFCEQGHITGRPAAQ